MTIDTIFPKISSWTIGEIFGELIFCDGAATGSGKLFTNQLVKGLGTIFGLGWLQVFHTHPFRPKGKKIYILNNNYSSNFHAIRVDTIKVIQSVSMSGYIFTTVIKGTFLFLTMNILEALNLKMPSFLRYNEW